MRETSKCYQMRQQRGDFDNYLRGYGIDIGCGDDPLTIPSGKVDRWDKQQGHAALMFGVEDNKYDFVYSSHCLEHMESVEVALKSWVRILKLGGWLYIVVPDYELYEKCTWPSRFNGDHKHSFSLDVLRTKVKRPNHWHLGNIIITLQMLGVTLLAKHLESTWYDWNRGIEDQTKGDALAQICFIGRKG